MLTTGVVESQPVEITRVNDKGGKGRANQHAFFLRLRSRVRGAVWFGPIVVAPILVFVRDLHIGLSEYEIADRRVPFIHGDLTRHGAQGVGRNCRMENLHLVAAGRNVTG